MFRVSTSVRSRGRDSPSGSGGAECAFGAGAGVTLEPDVATEGEGLAAAGPSNLEVLGAVLRSLSAAENSATEPPLYGGV